MNKQRQQAYFNLIQSLLNCRSHDEVREILTKNQELVDVGLNWLQDLPMQLGEALNLDTKLVVRSRKFFWTNSSAKAVNFYFSIKIYLNYCKSLILTLRICFIFITINQYYPCGQNVIT